MDAVMVACAVVLALLAVLCLGDDDNEDRSDRR